VLSHRIAGIDTGLGHAVLGDFAVTVRAIQPVRAAVDTACCHAMR
jgi:hypothetical protein